MVVLSLPALLLVPVLMLVLPREQGPVVQTVKVHQPAPADQRAQLGPAELGPRRG